jgi:tetratricopeptide (TPR) repeat protein
MRLKSVYTFLLLQVATIGTEAQKSDSLYVLNGTISYGFNRLNDKSRFRETDSTVIFFLRNYDNAKKVFLSGNFCRWSPDKWAMKKTDSGWTVEIKFNTGKYWYKFVIDDNWKLDPDNILVEKDLGGYFNSIFYKTNAQFQLPSYTNAKKVFLTGSFNNWKPDQLQMIRTKTGWEFPLYLVHGSYTYQFIVDGNPIADPKNNDRIGDAKTGFKSVIHIDDFLKDLYGWNRFRKGGFFVKDSTVRFFLRDHHAAKQIYLSGSWINWETNLLPMAKTDSGWIANVKLAPGKYWYLFIADGTWMSDPDNLLDENTNSEAYNNALFYKTNVLFGFSSFTSAKKVFLTGSFNNWKPYEIEMVKTATGWELPVFLSGGTHKYGYIIDGVYYPDPESIDRLVDKTGRLVSVIHITSVFNSVEYYQAQLIIDEQLEDKNKIADDYAAIGFAYQAKPEHENAMKYFQMALNRYEQLDDFGSMGDMFLNLAEEYHYFFDFHHELDHLKRAILNYQKSTNKIGWGKAQQSLGRYFMNLKYYKKALEYFQGAVALFEPIDQQKEVAGVLCDMAYTYSFVPDPARQFEYVNKALKINEQIGNQTGMADNYWVLGDYYRASLNFPLAVSYYQRANKIFEQTSNKKGIAEILYSFAAVYTEASDSIIESLGIKPIEKYNKATSDLKKSLKIFTDTRQLFRQMSTLLFISEINERAGNYNNAYSYYKQFIELRENFLDAERQKQIIMTEIDYYMEKKQDSLTVQQELTNEKLQKQLLLARQQQQQIELNQTQLALTNKEKDLQHLEFLKAQSDLENEKLVKQQKEKENQLQSVQVKSLTQKNEIIQLNQQRQWIYIAGGFVLLALGSLYFIYRSRLRGVKLEAQLIKEKAEQEKKETEFQHKLGRTFLCRRYVHK